jgi:hypothetical protein
MKKRTVILFVAIAALVLVGLTSCGFNGTMAGTEWRASALGTGIGLVFEDTSNGHTTVGILGTWGANVDFTYTYDTIAKTGAITLAGFSSSDPFTVDGNELTYLGVTYKYQ